MLYKVLVHCNSYIKQLYLSNQTVRFSYIGGCVVLERMRNEAIKTRAGLGYTQMTLAYY